MSLLNMASVTATAITGTFRQPYLVSPRLDGHRVATARGLRAGTAAQLKQMMRLTATQGTAAPNSWFTGFRDDLAAAAMSEQGGHGGDAAGPIVRAVLAASG